jgi:hypothetical protein
MCMNCGCGQPNEDHGNAANITADELRRAGDANGQSLRESAQHIIETVELLDSSGRRHEGLAQPAGPTGPAADGGAPRGTPATES